MHAATMWKVLRNVGGVILLLLSGALTTAKRIADWVGRTTFQEDAEALGPKVAKMFEWLADQPALLFYGGPAILTLVGIGLLLAPNVSRWKRSAGEEQPSPVIPVQVPPITPQENQNLKTVVGAEYQNETVALDGHHFINCTFVNVTIKYNGGPYKMNDCRVGIPIKIESENLSLMRGIGLMQQLYPGERTERTDGSGRTFYGMGILVTQAPPDSAAQLPPPQDTGPKTQP